MFGITDNFLWKGATGLLSLLLAIAVINVFAQKLTISELRQKKSELTAEIDDPVTGYRVRLSQSEANVISLSNHLKLQNDAYAALQEDYKLRVEGLTKTLAQLNASRDLAKKRAEKTLAFKPTGTTVCARIQEIDAAFKERLLP